jgi:DNA-binding response OmpR family regulator
MTDEFPRPRVLLVDDDPALVRMVRLVLLSDGFDVVTAESGYRALDQLTDAQFDAVVLDLQMPNLDGRECFKEIRSRGYGVPVLILSAYGAEQARHELGAQAAVIKPFDPADFLKTVRAMIDQAQPARL